MAEVESGTPAPESPAGGVVATEAAQPAAASSPAAVDVTPASSPGKDGADGVKEPGTALEALFKAREKITKDETGKIAVAHAKAGDSPPTDPASKKDADASTVKADAGDGAETPKKDAPARVKELLAERKEILPRAESFDQLANWVQSRNLTQEDFNTALEIGALMKNDPHAAWKRLQPIVEQLQIMVGEVLPDDLAQKVTDGQIDEETARELARTRTRATVLEQTRERDTAAATEQREIEQQAQFLRTVGNTVQDWEKEWKRTDLDYARKAPFVSNQIAALMQSEGIPQTAPDAIKLAKRALEMVEQQMQGLVAPARGIRIVTGGSQTGTTAPQPKTSIEAMNLAAQTRSAA